MAQINLGHVVGQGVPSGGTAGQILKKNGSTNFDTSWATLDGSMVPVSANDSTTVQQSLAAVKSDMGIVEDGNTATHTISAGQYVIWKGALYTASAAIPAGTTLSTSNLTAVSGGGLNALNGKIANLVQVPLTYVNNDFITAENLSRCVAYKRSGWLYINLNLYHNDKTFSDFVTIATIPYTVPTIYTTIAGQSQHGKSLELRVDGNSISVYCAASLAADWARGFVVIPLLSDVF